MSYALASALQTAVFQALYTEPAITAAVGSAIYDAVPAGDVPDMYISLGPELATDASDKSGQGAVHKFTLSVHSDAPGFAKAKEIAGAVCDALVDADLPMNRGRLVALRFDRASASRTDAGKGRKIDLRFAARVEDS